MPRTVGLKQLSTSVSVPTHYKLAASGHSLAAKSYTDRHEHMEKLKGETVMVLSSPVETQKAKDAEAKEPLTTKAPAGQGLPKQMNALP